MKLTNARAVYVDSRKAVKLVEENPNRRVLNVKALDSDLYYGGNSDVEANLSGFRIRANQTVEIKSGAEIWVIRANNTAGNCQFQEELN